MFILLTETRPAPEPGPSFGDNHPNPTGPPLVGVGNNRIGKVNSKGVGREKIFDYLPIRAYCRLRKST